MHKEENIEHQKLFCEIFEPKSFHEALEFICVLSSKDWSEDKLDALIHGIIIGWSDTFLNELKIKFNWKEGTIKKLKHFHTQYIQATDHFQNDKNENKIDLNNKSIKTIGLFGSMRFRKEFLRLEKEFTFQNYLVLMPYLDGMFHKKRYKNEQWESLMAQSYRRIELSDIIFVVNKRRYIGTHTKQEIEFAQHLKKEIRYLEE